MKKNLIVIFAALFCCLSVAAQPYRGVLRRRPHHTHRLPGVNEHRLARLEKMRNANLQLRHAPGPLRAKTQPETKRGLVLLVQFSDMDMRANASTQWTNRFNQVGYSQSSHIGSVRDYFLDQSYGLLDIDFDVVGPLTVSKGHDYYGTPPNDDLDDRAPEMVIEALKLADSMVNYADYDWDGDGEVDQVYVIYAGMTSDSEQGYIWPHEWILSAGKYYGSGSGMQRLDGVYIDTYAVSNELASSTVLNGIGTACHEFSHCLGYPDFYDTEYSGGTAAQNWDVMDGGSYNGPRKIGEVPSPYTAYERWLAGWLDLIPLTQPAKVTDMPAINTEGVAYVISNTGNSNEYYILENRQQKTFGRYNGGHGLMVWHIDYNATVWENNAVNSTKSHQRMTFLPADGKVGDLEYYDGSYFYDITAEDEAGDPYPGRKKVQSVAQLTWFTSEKGGTKKHQNLIHDITEAADGTISFVYGNYVPLSVPELAQPTILSAESFDANWLAVDGATSYNLQVEEVTDEPSRATLLSEDFSGFSSISDGQTIGSSTLDSYMKDSGWKSSYIYGTAGDAIRISAQKASGYVTTPVMDNKTGELYVDFDAAYYGTDGSSVVVSVLNGSQTVATQTVALTAGRKSYSLTFADVPAGSQVKFASTAVKKRFYLYQVDIQDMSGSNGKVTTYTGLTTTSHTVPTTDTLLYYYRVQAVCADGTSEWSDWMEVVIPDAINNVRADDADGSDAIYDLSGRRLQQVPRSGIWLRGGKVWLSR